MSPTPRARVRSGEPRLVALLVACLGAMAAPALVRATPNDQDHLVPDTTVRGPVLELDFPEIRIGIAEYAEGPTGTTVFHFAEPVMAQIDVRGGSPGVLNAPPLQQPNEGAFTNAVVFSGGSSYGLSAATGAAEAIKETQTRAADWRSIAFVPGAIIFDLGGRRLNAITPDAKLGAAALRAATPGEFPLGAQGAGRFAMQGWQFEDPQHSGQGGAFRQVGQTKVAVFTVVNAVGGIVDRDGFLVRTGIDGRGPRTAVAERLARRLEEALPRDVPTSPQGKTTNTTLTLVVTNEKLTVAELQRLAIQVHEAMARSIQPFSTSDDGDTLVAATTAQVETPGLSKVDLGILASEVAWDAVLASVPELPAPLPTEPVRWSPEAMDAVAGTYRFSRWASVRLERDDEGLVLHGPGAASLYFPETGPVRLVPVGRDLLRVEHGRRYHLQVEREGDRVLGLLLEPGPWAQRAARVDTSG